MHKLYLQQICKDKKKSWHEFVDIIHYRALQKHMNYVHARRYFSIKRIQCFKIKFLVQIGRNLKPMSLLQEGF